MTTGNPHQLHPGHLPTPFTAEEIRGACRPGRELRLRVERLGHEPVIHVARYVGGDEEMALQESWDESPAGDHLSEPEPSRETWLDLQAHASFPAASTERAEETIDIAAGPLACLRYTQTLEDGMRTFWFAKDLPGQPVRWEIRSGNQLVLAVVLLENTPAPR
ncbi:MAG: hypothetical protein ACXWL8_02930 [Candidatus Limnocylindria bacterium]